MLPEDDRTASFEFCGRDVYGTCHRFHLRINSSPSLPSPSLFVQRERERNANAGQIRVLIVERERGRIINNTEYRVIKIINK